MALVFYLLLLFLHHSSFSSADPHPKCGGDNYIINSTYNSNFNNLLTFFISLNSTTFTTRAEGSTPDCVYGLILCRGDVSSSDCTSCIQNATQDVLYICPMSKQATLWYDYCELRYSDLQFFSSFGNYRSPILYDAQNATGNVENFIQTQRNLLVNVTHHAAYNSPLMFATGTAMNGSEVTVYGLAQCTRDLSKDGCSQCLKQIRGQSRYLEARRGGMVLGQSCNFRYSVYPFYQGKPTVLLNLTASLPPSSSTTPSTPPSAGGKGKRKKKTTIIIGAGSAAMLSFLLVCLSLALYFYKHRKVSKSVIFQKKNLNNNQKIEAFLEGYESITPRRYSYSNVKKITKAFQEKLGQGGYGTVFKGTLGNGHMVAVKILNDSKGDGEEFINEVASIGKTFHVNVVNLLGFCHEGSKRALIYDFMCNGSLEKLLYSEMPKTTFDWEKLHQIAIGIARGLEYLHRGCSTRIVHFDIKPHNILLDQDFCPKISDFGLAKLCLKKESIISIAGARGTIGYIAPEVFSRNFGVVSSKSDVYSYGMMVLEIAGGRKNPNEGVENSSEKYFPHWIYAQLDQNGDLLSSGVAAESEEIARKMVLVGLWCIQTMPEYRPSMSKVIEMIDGSVDDLQIPPKPYLSSSPFGSIVGTSSIEDICSIDCIDSSVHS